jgi:hypothetical protein
MGHSRLPRTPHGERIRGDGRDEDGVRVHLCEQPGGGNLQGLRKAEQRQDRNIAPPLFNLAEIPMTYARSGRECLLVETPLLPVLAEGRPKALERRVLRAGRGRWRVAVCHRRIPSLLKV